MSRSPRPAAFDQSLVDTLKQQMLDLEALREKVAKAESARKAATEKKYERPTTRCSSTPFRAPRD